MSAIVMWLGRWAIPLTARKICLSTDGHGVDDLECQMLDK